MIKLENMILEESENSPKVILDQERGLIEFEGRSYPENTFAFYRPITEWLKKYFEHCYTGQALTVNFKFLYFNSATTQIIFEILDIVKEGALENIEVNWFYNAENNNGWEDYEDYSEEFPELNINAVVLGDEQ